MLLLPPDREPLLITGAGAICLALPRIHIAKRSQRGSSCIPRNCLGCSTDPFAHGFTLGDDKLGILGNESFHPNAAGHERLTELASAKWGATIARYATQAADAQGQRRRTTHAATLATITATPANRNGMSWSG